MNLKEIEKRNKVSLKEIGKHLLEQSKIPINCEVIDWWWVPSETTKTNYLNITFKNARKKVYKTIEKELNDQNDY